MKRNNLTTSVVAGLAAIAGIASTANAVELNPDGLGQVLIYPYYTVNDGQTTLISVVNTADIAKAVKVRFLEGYNSREVLDFNLFLSPFDVWTANVFALSDATLPGDGAALGTTDKSCTAPDKNRWSGTITSGGQTIPYKSFLNYAYTGRNVDTGPIGFDRTREGHIELISMADLSGALASAVTHRAGVPNNCSVVQQISSTNTLLTAPTSGLFGAGGIVNVSQGTFYTYNADAIDGFTNRVLFSDQASLTPSLAQAVSYTDVSGQDFATAYVFGTGGQLIRSDYLAGGATNNAIDAVSAVFMSANLYNEYNVDSGVGSNTDWVVTFPTKRFYVDHQFLGVPLRGPGAIRPFVFTFGEDADGNGDGLSCSEVGINQYDREEGEPSEEDNGFSPPPPDQPPSALCREVNVISFLNIAAGQPAPTESGVLASKLVTNIDPYAATGWLNLDMSATPHRSRASVDGDVYTGLPATGFQAVNYVNANVTAGVMSNYSGLFRHRASRACANGTAVCS